MTSLASGAAAALLAVSTPAAAQDHIRPGETIEGALESGDRAQGGSYFDCYRWSAAQGDRQIRALTLRSSDFQARLSASSAGCAEATPFVATAAASGGMAHLTLANPGVLYLRVDGVTPDAGAYSLQLAAPQEWRTLWQGDDAITAVDISSIVRRGARVRARMAHVLDTPGRHADGPFDYYLATVEIDCRARTTHTTDVQIAAADGTVRMASTGGGGTRPISSGTMADEQRRVLCDGLRLPEGPSRLQDLVAAHRAESAPGAR